MRGRIVVHYKHFYLLMAVALVLIGLAADYNPIFSYIDELVAAIAIPILLKRILKNTINKQGKTIIRLLFVIVLIGIISTLVSKISPVVPSLMDAFLFIKPFVVFLVFYCIPQKYKDYIMVRIKPIAKCLLIVTCIFGCISQFVDIGMTIGNEKIFFINVKVFGFILNNGIQTVWLSVACFLCVCYCVRTEKEFVKYAILYFTILILTIGGFGSILLLCSVLFLYLFRKNKQKKLKIWQMGIVSVIGFFVAFSDISTYLLNSAAPRALLLKYGFITANKYFPLGSGFASYGSEMARRYYSPLYYSYGFNNIWSLSYENSTANSAFSTLKDVYLGMIVGQYGWIGLLTFITLMVVIFLMLNRKEIQGRTNALSLAAFITIVVTMMVSANSTSQMGIFLFAILGLSTKIDT